MSKIVFACSTCGQEFDAPDTMAGKITDCPACKARIQVPESGGVKVLMPISKRLPMQNQNHVVIVDVNIPFNSICWICMKVVFVLILMSAAFAGLYWIAIGIMAGINR